MQHRERARTATRTISGAVEVSARELFDAALALARKPALTIDLATDLLMERLHLRGDRGVLADLLGEALADHPHFARDGNLYAPRDREEALRRGARALLALRSVEAKMHGISIRREVPDARPPAPPRSHAGAALPRSHAGTAPPRSDAGAARPRKHSPPAPAPPRKDLPADPIRSPRIAPDSARAQPAPSPDPPPSPPAVRFDAKAIDLERAFDAMDSQRSRGLDRVALALQASHLALAEQFSELLAPRALAGVDSHRYQIETARRVLKSLRGRALLADEVGLGKTIEALMILREYQLRGMVRRALILVPPALVRQWSDELQSKGGLEARTTESPELRQSPEQFFARDGVVIASLATARSSRFAPAVVAQAWDMVIVDEAHRVKNRSTVSFKLVNDLKSRFLLLLTATPIESDLEEIYNLVTLLKPGQLTTLASFRRQFLDKARPTHPKNRETLRGLLREVMIRNTRATCGLKLPPRYVSTIRVEPHESERRLYGAVVDLLRKHARDSRARLTASTLLLEAGSSPDAIAHTIERLRESGKPSEELELGLEHIEAGFRAIGRSRKSDALIEIVRSSTEPVLVFTRYRATLDHITRALAEVGFTVRSFHGGLDSARKSAALDAFRTGAARVLIATDVGGEGQNLQFCRTLVNYDLPWNPMVIEQRIGRLHRMGQTGEVRVFNLCARGTIEDRVLEVLDERLHLFELVVGEMDMVLGNLTDDKDLEERILDLVAASKDDADIKSGFERIVEEVGAARGRHERAKELDAQVFGEDFEA